MAEPYRPVAPVDPTNLRPMMFLDVARAMMLNQDWSHRAVSVVMESHTGPGASPSTAPIIRTSSSTSTSVVSTYRFLTRRRC
jgi:hypothetical protein